MQKKHYSFNFQLSRGRLSFPRVSKGSKRRVRRGRADQTEKQQQDKGWPAADLPGYCHMCTTLQHFSTLHLSPKLLSLADIALHSTSAKYYLALVPSIILYAVALPSSQIHLHAGLEWNRKASFCNYLAVTVDDPSGTVVTGKKARTLEFNLLKLANSAPTPASAYSCFPPQ